MCQLLEWTWIFDVTQNNSKTIILYKIYYCINLNNYNNKNQFHGYIIYEYSTH